MDDEAQHVALLQILGIEALPKDQQDEILDGLEELTDERAMAYLYELMPEEEREHFLQIAGEAEDEDEFLAYVTQYIPHAEDIMDRAADEVMNEFVSGLATGDGEDEDDELNAQ